MQMTGNEHLAGKSNPRHLQTSSSKFVEIPDLIESGKEAEQDDVTACTETLESVMKDAKDYFRNCARNLEVLGYCLAGEVPAGQITMMMRLSSELEDMALRLRLKDVDTA